MHYQTPIEQRKALGIRVRSQLAEIPTDLRKPIPPAEWLNHPEKFDRQKFIQETQYFIQRVYGFELETYQHAVWLLASEMQTYIQANIGFIQSGSQIVMNGKESPWLKVRDVAAQNIMRLNRLLGLTPSSRLAATTLEKPAKDIYEVLPFPNTKQDKNF